MILPRSNTKLLDSILQARDHLEHIAVSFAFDAQDFFDHCKGTELKALKTLALTYSFNGVPHEEFLVTAAEAAKKMPALEMLEIWDYQAGTVGAHIFRYEKIDRAKSRITWQSTGDHSISKTVHEVWRDALAGGIKYKDDYELEVGNIRFGYTWITNLKSLFSYLKLRKQILHESTWKQLQEH
ncbi:hypothetical protein IL306_011282 [Fusarium sp. DS 682]|nr:hypothetical protein IL306_011282 [Fusarium sp. DS 682]